MNFKNLVLLVSIVSIAFFSCKDTPENPELDNYVNKTMPAFMKEELAIMKEFDSLTNVKKINEPKTDTLVRTIIIPKYAKFIEKLDTISIKDTALIKIHQQYINVSRAQLENLTYFIGSIKEDMSKRSDSLMQKVSRQGFMMSNWNKDIRALCAKYDIPFLGK